MPSSHKFSIGQLVELDRIIYRNVTGGPFAMAHRRLALAVMFKLFERSAAVTPLGVGTQELTHENYELSTP